MSTPMGIPANGVIGIMQTRCIGINSMASNNGHACEAQSQLERFKAREDQELMSV
jgi:hypothetical protein